MGYSGKAIKCIKNFFIFTKEGTYYCSHEDSDHFYIINKGTKYHASYFKIPKSLKGNFITREEYYENKTRKHKLK